MCDALRLKWISKNIGFERIILKNSKIIGYFPSDASSPYYNSDIFKKVEELFADTPLDSNAASFFKKGAKVVAKLEANPAANSGSKPDAKRDA